jgi:hypothetical protein
MTAVVSFRFRTRAEERLAGREIRIRDPRLQGLVRLDGPALRLEWSGTVSRVEVRGPEVHSEVEQIPITRLEIPVGRLAGFTVGGWLRPRVELRATELETLDGVPTAHLGHVRLWIPRREIATARRLAADVEIAMADEALRLAEEA